MHSLLCLCGSILNYDGEEYYCENCPEIRFSRYVISEGKEVELIHALNDTSKNTVKVVDVDLSLGADYVHYLALTYTFTKSAKNWVLTNVESTNRVLNEKDPDIVSDQIQMLLQKSGADFCFYRET